MVQMGQPEVSQWRWRDGLSATLASLLLIRPEVPSQALRTRACFIPPVFICFVFALLPSVLWILVMGSGRGTIKLSSGNAKLQAFVPNLPWVELSTMEELN